MSAPLPQLFGLQKVAVQLDETRMLEFLSYWDRYDMPLPITFRKAKTPGLVAVTFTINPRDYRAMEFMQRAVEKTGGKLWNITNGNP